MALTSVRPSVLAEGAGSSWVPGDALPSSPQLQARLEACEEVGMEGPYSVPEGWPLTAAS